VDLTLEAADVALVIELDDDLNVTVDDELDEELVAGVLEVDTAGCCEIA
jgi:hypothetical protein